MFNFAKEKKKFQDSLKIALGFVLILLIIHVFQEAVAVSSGTDTPFAFLGVRPWQEDGIIGIFTSPFIHGSFSHLASNSVPLFVTTTMLFYFYRTVAIRSYVLIHLLTGIAVWFLARSSSHIGASGVVYGLVAFVFWSGVFRRNIKSIILALIVLFLYSGMFLGVLPNQEGISWESHLFGGIAGVIVAYLFRHNLEPREIEEQEQKRRWATQQEEPKSFFDENTFKN